MTSVTLTKAIPVECDGARLRKLMEVARIREPKGRHCIQKFDCEKSIMLRPGETRKWTGLWTLKRAPVCHLFSSTYVLWLRGHVHIEPAHSFRPWNSLLKWNQNCDQRLRQLLPKSLFPRVSHAPSMLILKLRHSSGPTVTHARMWRDLGHVLEVSTLLDAWPFMM